MIATEARPHIFLDWNGTTIDDAPLAIKAFGNVLESFGYRPVSHQEYRDTVRHPVRDWLCDGLKLPDVTEERFLAMTALFNRHYLAGRNDCRLHDHVVEMLTDTSEHGVDCSILSAQKQELVDSGVDSFKLRHHFKRVVGAANELAEGKIREALILIDELRLSPDKIVVIGDMDHDYEVADALGAHCVLVSHGFQSESRLSKISGKIKSVLVPNLLEAKTAVLELLGLRAGPVTPVLPG